MGLPAPMAPIMGLPMAPMLLSPMPMPIPIGPFMPMPPILMPPIPMGAPMPIPSIPMPPMPIPPMPMPELWPKLVGPFGMPHMPMPPLWTKLAALLGPKEDGALCPKLLAPLGMKLPWPPGWPAPMAWPEGPKLTTLPPSELGPFAVALPGPKLVAPLARTPEACTALTAWPIPTSGWPAEAPLAVTGAPTSEWLPGPFAAPSWLKRAPQPLAMPAPTSMLGIGPLAWASRMAPFV
mmetsp:Transcript_63136/g.195881  ORF Transcript_63136/g.195881 Transcript_63136/m.195881 type:complete len:236 (+) Transcript_63136:430-1137(+)